MTQNITCSFPATAMLQPSLLPLIHHPLHFFSPQTPILPQPCTLQHSQGPPQPLQALPSALSIISIPKPITSDSTIYNDLFDREVIPQGMYSSHYYTTSTSDILKNSNSPKKLFSIDLTHSTPPYYLSSRISTNVNEQPYQNKRYDMHKISPSFITSPNLTGNPKTQDFDFISALATFHHHSNPFTIIGGKRAICLLPYSSHSLLPSQPSNSNTRPFSSHLHGEINDSAIQPPLSNHTSAPQPFFAHLLPSCDQSSSPPLIYFDTPSHVTQVQLPLSHTSFIDNKLSNSNSPSHFFSSHLSGHLAYHDILTEKSFTITQFSSPITQFSNPMQISTPFTNCLLVANQAVNLIDIRYSSTSSTSSSPVSSTQSFQSTPQATVQTMKLQNLAIAPITAFHTIPRVQKFSSSSIRNLFFTNGSFNSSKNQKDARPYQHALNHSQVSPKFPQTTFSQTMRLFDDMTNRRNILSSSSSDPNSHRIGLVPRSFRRNNYKSSQYRSESCQNDSNSQNGQHSAQKNRYSQCSSEIRAKIDEEFAQISSNIIESFDLSNYHIIENIFWCTAWNPWKDYEIAVGNAHGVSIFDLRLGKELYHFNPVKQLDIFSLIQVMNLSEKEMYEYGGGHDHDNYQLDNDIETNNNDNDDNNGNTNDNNDTKHTRKRSKLHHYDKDDRVCNIDQTHSTNTFAPPLSKSGSSPLPEYYLYKKKHPRVGVNNIHFLTPTLLLCTTTYGEVYIYSTLTRQQEQVAKSMSNTNNSTIGVNQLEQTSTHSINILECGIMDANTSIYPPDTYNYLKKKHNDTHTHSHNNNFTQTCLPISFSSPYTPISSTQPLLTPISSPLLRTHYDYSTQLLSLPSHSTIRLVDVTKVIEKSHISLSTTRSFTSPSLSQPSLSSSLYGDTNNNIESTFPDEIFTTQFSQPNLPSIDILTGTTSPITCIQTCQGSNEMNTENIIRPHSHFDSHSHWFLDEQQHLSSTRQNYWNNTGIVAGTLDGSVLVFK